MTDGLSRSEKGRELLRIKSCLDGLEHLLAEISEKGEAAEVDLDRIEKGLTTARGALERLYEDYNTHGENWGP